jgi:hypothetical protein
MNRKWIGLVSIGAGMLIWAGPAVAKHSPPKICSRVAEARAAGKSDAEIQKELKLTPAKMKRCVGPEAKRNDSSHGMTRMTH